MIKWLLLTLVLISPISFGVEVVPTLPKPHKTVYNHILKNKPDLDPEYAENLAWAVYKASKRHKVNPLKVSAILRQESGYKLDAINRITEDYGLGQVNVRTIKAFKMDKYRLLADLEYSVDMAVLVLADFKRMYGKREKNWYSRYNSSNQEKRKEYEQLIARYL